MNARDFPTWSDRLLTRVEQALVDWVPVDAPAGLAAALLRP